MTWFGYVLLTYWAANVLVAVSIIGRRIEYTAGMAVFSIVCWSLLAWGAITVGTTQP